MSWRRTSSSVGYLASLSKLASYAPPSESLLVSSPVFATHPLRERCGASSWRESAPPPMSFIKVLCPGAALLWWIARLTPRGRPSAYCSFMFGLRVFRLRTGGRRRVMKARLRNRRGPQANSGATSSPREDLRETPQLRSPN